MFPTGRGCPDTSNISGPKVAKDRGYHTPCTSAGGGFAIKTRVQCHQATPQPFDTDSVHLISKRRPQAQVVMEEQRMELHALHIPVCVCGGGEAIRQIHTKLASLRYERGARTPHVGTKEQRAELHAWHTSPPPPYHRNRVKRATERNISYPQA